MLILMFNFVYRCFEKKFVFFVLLLNIYYKRISCLYVDNFFLKSIVMCILIYCVLKY